MEMVKEVKMATKGKFSINKIRRLQASNQKHDHQRMSKWQEVWKQ